MLPLIDRAHAPFREQGDDTIYVLPDGQEDRIHCDDPQQGDSGIDRVVYVGGRDPLDVIVLKALSWHPMHGLAIAAEARELA